MDRVSQRRPNVPISQHNAGNAAANRKAVNELSVCELETGLTREQLIQQQRDLKAAYLERSGKKAA